MISSLSITDGEFSFHTAGNNTSGAGNGVSWQTRLTISYNQNIYIWGNETGNNRAILYNGPGYFGIYGSSSNSVDRQLRFHTAGGSASERMRLSSDGFFLVNCQDTGFSSGYTDMTIGNTSASNTGLTIASSASNGYGRIHFADATSGNAKYAGWIAYDHANDEIIMSTANSGSTKLALTSGGHLELHGGKIYGDDGASNTFTLQSTSGNNNHSRIEIGASQSSDNGGIHFYTAGTSTATRHMTLKGTSGYLGIGVNNPVMPLEVDNKSTGTTEANKRIVGFYKSSASSSSDREGYIHLGSWPGHYGVKLGYYNEGASPGYHNSGFFISTIYSNQDITNHTKKFEVLSTGTVKLNRDLVITGNRSAGVSSSITP